MSPENYAEAWRKADADYALRHRAEVAGQVEALLADHDWRGGYYCACGQPVNMPASWGRHLLELALLEDDGASP